MAIIFRKSQTPGDNSSPVTFPTVTPVPSPRNASTGYWIDTKGESIPVGTAYDDQDEEDPSNSHSDWINKNKDKLTAIMPDIHGRQFRDVNGGEDEDEFVRRSNWIRARHFGAMDGPGGEDWLSAVYHLPSLDAIERAQRHHEQVYKTPVSAVVHAPYKGKIESADIYPEKGDWRTQFLNDVSVSRQGNTSKSIRFNLKKSYPSNPEAPLADMEHVSKKLMRSNKYHQILEDHTEGGPFDGGCMTHAMAMQKVFGGDLHGLHDHQGVVQHAVLRVPHGNTHIFLDANGPATDKEIMRRFSEDEMVPIAGHRPLADNDLDEAVRSHEAAESIAGMARKILSKPRVQKSIQFSLLKSNSVPGAPVAADHIPNWKGTYHYERQLGRRKRVRGPHPASFMPSPLLAPAGTPVRAPGDWWQGDKDVQRTRYSVTWNGQGELPSSVQLCRELRDWVQNSDEGKRVVAAQKVRDEVTDNFWYHTKQYPDAEDPQTPEQGKARWKEFHDAIFEELEAGHALRQSLIQRITGIDPEALNSPDDTNAPFARVSGQLKGWRNILGFYDAHRSPDPDSQLEYHRVRGLLYMSHLAAVNPTVSRLSAQKKLTFIKDNTGRAYYDNEHIYMTPLSGGATVVHESGHWLEDIIPGWRDKATNFIKSRSTGGPRSLFYLTGLGYSAQEIAWPDHFPDAYAGKLYPGGETEAISVGLEHLLFYPQHLLRDEHYFDFLHGLLFDHDVQSYDKFEPKDHLQGTKAPA